MSFDIPKISFDSVEGIRNSLQTLRELNKMLEYRKTFMEMQSKEGLDEFIIWGLYRLDHYGQVFSINKTSKATVVITSDVENLQTFVKNNPWVTFCGKGYAIPKEKSICPICGKEITISDVKNNPCIEVDGIFYHESCFQS